MATSTYSYDRPEINSGASGGAAFHGGEGKVIRWQPRFMDTKHARDEMESEEFGEIMEKDVFEVVQRG